MNELNQKKLERLTEATFDLLWSDFHKQSEFHQKYTINAIGDSIYKFGPRLFSGLISEKAKQALDSGDLVRSQLCKEHPTPRQDSAIEVINTFDYLRSYGCSNSIIKTSISLILKNGCNVNLVLSEENTALVPHQKQGLPAEQCYKLADITLVPDIKKDSSDRVYHYNGKTYKTQPEIVRDLNISRTTVQRRIKQGLITVERIAA